VPPEQALELLRPLAPERMRADDCSPLVSSPDNEGRELLDPLLGGPDQLSLL
jgi:hypothetical protein